MSDNVLIPGKRVGKFFSLIPFPCVTCIPVEETKKPTDTIMKWQVVMSTMKVTMYYEDKQGQGIVSDTRGSEVLIREVSFSEEESL